MSDRAYFREGSSNERTEVHDSASLDWFSRSGHSENHYRDKYKNQNEADDPHLYSLAMIIPRRQHTVRVRTIVPNSEFIAHAQIGHRRLRNSLQTFRGVSRSNVVVECYYCLVDRTAVPVLTENDGLFLS
jgi:hypothetical protein